MSSSTNVEARAVNTLEWLSASNTTIAVPVYQRHYRWDINACRRLLEDILAVERRENGQTHFIGSILASSTTKSSVTELTLIDGQQRVTTLMLLITALRDGSRNLTEFGASQKQLESILRHPGDPDQTRLRPHKVGAGTFTDIISGRLLPGEARGSAFDENYQFFLREIHARDANARVWRGLQKLEHVAITLKENANPQQIFESLNSTGAPLADHELIHNYVLMGLSHSQQTEIEESFWVPIEENTGDAQNRFWRDYLIMKTGRDTEFSGEHGVYDVFREQFPQLSLEPLRKEADEWRAYSAIYRILLDPTQSNDVEITTHLNYLNILGTSMYPFLLAVYRDYRSELIDKSRLVEVLEAIQSLLIRRMVVGQTRDHLAAQLCRRRLRGARNPFQDILRRTPSDERVRSALRHRNVPHVGYVLGRIERLRFPGDGNTGLPAGLEIEHVFPQNPTDAWSGDGLQVWGALTEEERARYRELLHTLGNVALLEEGLNAGASNKSFQDKKCYYRRSLVQSTKHLADVDVWDVAAIENRTAKRIADFLEVWQRPPIEEIPGELTPILDAPKKSGYYQGWKTEFEYVKFGDEIWEVHNYRELRVRLYQHLWETRPNDLLSWDLTRHESYPHIRAEKDPGYLFQQLGESHFLYNGWFPQFLLGDIQELLDELNLADELLLKYTADPE